MSKVDWEHYAQLVAEDRSVIGQGIAWHPFGWVLTQGRKMADGTEDLIVTNFDLAGRGLGTRTFVGAGHGDRVQPSLAHPGEICVKTPRGWRLTRGHALDAFSLTESLPPRRAWFQGECGYGRWLFRVYGSPMNADGFIYPDGRTPPTLEVWRADELAAEYDLKALGRLRGIPFGGRSEIEGVTIAQNDNGTMCLAVGVATGRKGSYAHQIYLTPIEHLTEEDMPLTPSEIETIAKKVLQQDGVIPNAGFTGNDANEYVALQTALVGLARKLDVVIADQAVIKKKLGVR